jgi:hypothetical protein
MELIIEQVSGTKKLLQRHKIKGSFIDIGRGYDNDLVLNDPYVCGRHLSLNTTEEGRWQMCDQGSVNGSFTDRQQPIEGLQPVYSGDVISIGKSYLRFIYPNQPVAPAIRLGGFEGVLNWLSSPAIVIAVFCLYISLLLGNYYVGSSVEIKASHMFSSVFTKLLVMSLLPLLFALLARLFKHDARVLTQMVVSYSFFIIYLLLDALSALISFNSNQQWMSNSFSYITQIMLVFAVLWSAFYIAFHQSQLRRTVLAGGLTITFFVLAYLNNAGNRSDFNPKPSYDNTLLAPEFALSEPVSIKEFIADSEAVFELVTKKAVKDK